MKINRKALRINEHHWKTMKNNANISKSIEIHRNTLKIHKQILKIMPGCVMLKSPTPSSLAQSHSDLNVAEGPPRRIFREHHVDLAQKLPQEHILLVSISKTRMPHRVASVLDLRNQHVEDLGPHLLEIDLPVTHLRNSDEGVDVPHPGGDPRIWVVPASRCGP